MSKPFTNRYRFSIISAYDFDITDFTCEVDGVFDTTFFLLRNLSGLTTEKLI